ncbi:uncharacterized protein Z519_08117 [Cladophialophora bantiana CBS 173.52]|uniref:DUF1446 domain-containing protein n=1 Tax=Cladophialophora bantiana (strain ATCC 10958 / CBS 173.52 / CDC B-1940 / NIH 8579) TaxID=1442370 RepID=A0A0D2EMH4_CLAB1|nr:uncharacterized protein Z519_08117 [Cladophialophora bantiana CBS 173.52]KIW91221.1 hypothetical protein Z519_08117 [Cladophialophora bantiana CBS 173.52]
MGDPGPASTPATRACRIANCSGARGDPGYQMRRQATLGPVDFITGDYLAEMNLAENAQKMAVGKHDGWEPTAWDGLEQTLDVIKDKGIRIIINGGALNPRGLAKKAQKFVNDRGLGLKVAYVYGDDLMEEVKASLEKTGQLPQHLDGENEKVSLQEHATDLLDTKGKPIVSANAYLGARAIVKGLELGADVIICGRVADASPVIGAAWYWHKWSDSDYDRLAGALVAGHLIECSAYATGSNFSGFDEYPLETFVDLSFGIAEIADDGTSIITKHDGTNGLVNEDNVKCQFLYELQGGTYLNSDVSADTTVIRINQVGKNRVRLSNIRGYPPPPTTKLAIFYHGGYEAQLLTNATGYATAEKWRLFETQIRHALKQKGLIDQYQLLDFQILGTPEANPRSQFSSTTYCRLFVQADAEAAIYGLVKAWSEIAMQHFSGFHLSLDYRTALPRSYLAFYPALYPQNDLKEGVAILSTEGEDAQIADAGHPPHYQKLAPRENYETAHPVDLASFGPTRKARLGDITLARSGDKGANINFGIFVRRAEHYPWLQTFMTRSKLQELMGDDWRDDFFIERMEFPNIWAVHFVIYGPLGRGVSSCRLLDALGKGFADYIRDKVVDVPERFLEDVDAVKRERRAML